MSQRTSDEPLTNPEQDLLGVDDHARTLARLLCSVPTPFTNGVHGDWGAGKTTFMYFLRHHLTRPQPDFGGEVAFVEFDAWRFKTADELWRALVLDIARRLYSIPDEPDDAKLPQRSTRPAWLDVFERDAIVLRGDEPLSGERAEFENLKTFLDQAMYGGIKSGGSALRLDQEDAIASAVKAGVSALGGLLPIVGGMRSLLGLGDGDGAERSDRDKNQATRSRIESIARFERTFRKIAKDKGYGTAGTRRLCVFIDNLDRCMPDIALDLLDAVKLFLKDSQFVFIVAADERLIGQGLEIRYKAVASGDAAARGQEYLEKLVQLRVHIPEPTQERMHRFVAAQFPEWMPATDIIYMTVGTNPRRLKQFCNWLSFRYEVDCPPDSMHVDDTRLLEKLIGLRWHDESCLRELARLANSGNYLQTMGDLEKSVLEAGEDAPQSTIAWLPIADPLKALVRQISHSHPLYSIVTAAPRFSSFSPSKVATLASIADLYPHPTLMLEATDRVFMRVLQHVSTAALTERLLLDDFTRLFTIGAKYPTILEAAQALARACPDATEWTRQTVSVERALQTGQVSNDALPAATALFHEVTKHSSPSPEPIEAAAMLLESPGLSEMLREVVTVHADARGSLPDVKGLFDAHVYSKASDTDKWRRLAKAVVDHLRGLPVFKVLTEGLELRQWAASHCIQMRSFAKLNAVDRRWPALGRTLRTDFPSVRWLETQILQPGEVPRQHESLWRQYGEDEEVRRFLALKPLFGEIDPALLKGYVLTSRVLAPSAETVPAAGATQPPGASLAAAPLSPEYADLTLQLVQMSPAVVGLPQQFAVTLLIPGVAPVTEHIGVLWDELNAAVAPFNQVSYAAPVSRGGAATRGILQVAADDDLQAKIRTAGTAMFNTFIRERVRAALEEQAESGRPYRLLLELDDGLRALPFEMLYSPRRVFLALTQRCSIVRYTQSATLGLQRPSLSLPLRVLAVLSNPANTAPLNLDGEYDILKRAMSAATETGRASLDALIREDATIGQLQDRLRAFRPHVVHFVGHGVFQPTGQGALVLHGPGGTVEFVDALRISTLLGDCGVRLAVLNACDTGIASSNDAITSVAGAVVHAGVPAVLATMRQVEDEAALQFAREFYRTFCEGFSMEAALAEARKALSVNRRDWSAYALFASTTQLGGLAIPRVTVRQSGATGS